MKMIRVNATWCPACIVMKKVWKQVEEVYPDMEYIDLDYDMDEEEVIPLNVGTLLPVTILYKEEKEFARLNGEKSKEQIINVIKEM